MKNLKSRSMLSCNRKLVTRPGVGTGAVVVMYANLEVKRLFMDLPALALVKIGKKIVSHKSLKHVVNQNEMIFLPPGKSFDVVNAPKDGQYEARLIAFDYSILRDTIATDEVSPTEVPKVIPNVSTDFLSSFESAFRSLENSEAIPESVSINRMRELIYWLKESKIRIEPRPKEGVTYQVREILLSEPGRDWKSTDVSTILAMSEATFRRRLAKEKQSFNNILIDVRMSSALNLLQATTISVTEVALSVGYDSSSRFSARFRERFGYLPSDVRKGFQ